MVDSARLSQIAVGHHRLEGLVGGNPCENILDAWLAVAWLQLSDDDLTYLLLRICEHLLMPCEIAGANLEFYAHVAVINDRRPTLCW